MNPSLGIEMLWQLTLFVTNQVTMRVRSALPLSNSIELRCVSFCIRLNYIHTNFPSTYTNHKLVVGFSTHLKKNVRRTNRASDDRLSVFVSRIAFLPGHVLPRHHYQPHKSKSQLLTSVLW